MYCRYARETFTVDYTCCKNASVKFWGLEPKGKEEKKEREKKGEIEKGEKRKNHYYLVKSCITKLL